MGITLLTLLLSLTVFGAEQETYGTNVAPHKRAFIEKIPSVNEEECNALLDAEFENAQKQSIIDGIKSLMQISKSSSEKISFADVDINCMGKILNKWDALFNPKLEDVGGAMVLDYNLPQAEFDTFFQKYKSRRIFTRYTFFLKSGGKPSQRASFCREFALTEKRDRNLTQRKLRSGIGDLAFYNFYTQKAWALSQKYGFSETESSTLYQYTNAYFHAINEASRVASIKDLATREKEAKKLGTASSDLYKSFPEFKEVFESALNRLPKVTTCQTNCAEGTPSHLVRWGKSTYQPHVEGCAVEYPIYLSTSSNPKFTLGDDSLERFIIFSKGKAGVDLRDVSIRDNESEILFLRGTKFMVLGKGNNEIKREHQSSRKFQEWHIAEIEEGENLSDPVQMAKRTDIPPHLRDPKLVRASGCE